MSVLERVWARNADLGDEQAMTVALEAQELARQQRL
jgi:hypothetical protein